MSRQNNVYCILLFDQLTLLAWIRGEAHMFFAVGNGAESRDDELKDQALEAS
jgi:hypothetical protein